jgi:hypothetical protein
MRIAVRIVAALVVLVLLAVGLLWIFQGRVVKTAVQSGGTWATGVETRVEDVSAGLLGGELELEVLSLANPPGFSTEPFFALQKAEADWETRSLFQPTIHVRELALEGLALRIERNASGTNYGVILDHARSLGGESKPKPTEPAGEERALVIDSIVLRDISAALVLSDLPITTGPMRVTVPRLEIKDFRSDGPTHEIVGQLLSAIVQAALESSLQAGSGVFPDDLARELKSKLAGAQASLDAALKSGEQGDLQGAVDEAGKALEGLKDVFGGQKKKH